MGICDIYLFKVRLLGNISCCGWKYMVVMRSYLGDKRVFESLEVVIFMK